MKLLRELPDAVSKRILAAAQKDALRQTSTAARKNLQSSTKKRTGNLHRAIGVKTLKSKELTPTSLAGMLTRRRGYHAHIIDGGTKMRYLKKPRVLSFRNRSGALITARVSETGFVRPSRFMTRAIDSTKAQVLADFEQKVANQIVKRMKALLGSSAAGMPETLVQPKAPSKPRKRDENGRFIK